MKRAFLDANVLFSAAYKTNASLTRLWQLPDVEFVTSAYAVEEATRNITLTKPDRLSALQDILMQMRIINDPTQFPDLPKTINLKAKDRPILAAAIATHCHYLITGDKTDFGSYYGQAVRGVLVLPPGEFFRLYNQRS